MKYMKTKAFLKAKHAKAAKAGDLAAQILYSQRLRVIMLGGDHT